jgi:hypothetical protein
MRNFIFGISLFALAVSSGQLLAADPVIFKTSGDSHYENGEIAVHRHGDALVMRARLVDRGRIHDVEATLDPQGAGHYRGSGKIKVRYEDGTGCLHRFGAAMTVQDDAIFLRENTPATIPWDPNGPCVPAGPYEWFNHPEPYRKQ